MPSFHNLSQASQCSYGRIVLKSMVDLDPGRYMSLCTHRYRYYAHTFIYSFMTRGLCSPDNPPVTFGHWEENRKHERKFTWKKWEHAKLPADGNLRSGLNREPCSCELKNSRWWARKAKFAVLMTILSFTASQSLVFVSSCTYMAKSMRTPAHRTHMCLWVKQPSPDLASLCYDNNLHASGMVFH